MPLTLLSCFCYLKNNRKKKRQLHLPLERRWPTVRMLSIMQGGNGLSNVSRDVTLVGIISSITNEQMTARQVHS